MPLVAPENVGSIGYDGFESFYVNAGPKQVAYEAEGLALEFYRSWNTSWFTPGTYFDVISNFSDGDVRPCEETTLSSQVEIEQYLNLTGDEAGVNFAHPDFNHPVGVCSNGSFWLAPRRT